MVAAPSPPDSDAQPPLQAVEERSYYSISQAAALLGVSRMTIWRWVRAGRLPVARLGHRTSRIRREDLDALLAERGPAEARLRIAPDGVPGADGQSHIGAPHADWRTMGADAHFVQFYEADAALL